MSVFALFCFVFCFFGFSLVSFSSKIRAINKPSNIFDSINVLSIVLNFVTSLQAPYPVMFDLQGRIGSGGQQGLAGTPGAAVRIEMNKIKTNGTQHTVPKVLTVIVNGSLNC